MIELITYTNNVREALWVHGKTSINQQDTIIINFEEWLDKLVYQGHMKVLEAVTFNFMLTDIPLDVVRHLQTYRHASIIEQSMRYVDVSEASYSTTDDELWQLAVKKYKENPKKELARRNLPIGIHTNLSIVANLAELIHIAKQRLCTMTQKDTRKVVQQMCDLVSEKFPEFEKYFQPKCVSMGFCNELRNKTCTRWKR